ncbi:MAG: winged helix-turn-helix domain-containing protein [Campylobacterota bacterium]|nr:winged helix-turn-helix domain-containing protein [Campylobacterota bacterium]
MIKRLRKLTNMKMACVTDDNQLQGQIQENFNDLKELTFIGSHEGAEDFSLKCDIIIVDYKIKDFLKIMENVRVLNPLLPKIVVLESTSESDIVNCINMGCYSIIHNPVNFEDLRLSAIVALNQSKRSDKILLNNGIYYDAYRERFYDDNGAITFTKFEFQLLKLLLDNHDKIVSYEDIKKYVWKEKNMSIFTMRNVVNKIRNKTYYDILNNNSSKGYQIDQVR